ncbi:MAG: hypothetical protein II568_07575, partial [Erysipelotrichaceae bacterium]|nr:hypothetical protein [Erysipelotrichaceae bacterium]
LTFLLLVVVHDEETQAEEHGKDAIHLAREQPSQHIGYGLVTRQHVYYRLFGKALRSLNSMMRKTSIGKPIWFI